MESEIEIKIKFKNEKNVLWEDMPVLITTMVDVDKIEKFVHNNFVNKDIYKVRWNFRESSQGHYIEMETDRFYHPFTNMENRK